MSKRRVTIGIIGLGTGAAPHLKSLADFADLMPVSLAATPSAERAKARLGLPFPVTTDVMAVIDHPDIEAVIIITPPNTHRELTLACLRAGKHVLIEKPIELTADRGQDMVELATACGLRLGVMLQHRLRPGALRLRAAVESGELGNILSASAIMNWWRPQAYYDEPGRGTLARDGGGVLLTQAIHTLDLFRSLVGFSGVDAAQVITTGAHRMETEDHVNALIRLANGAPGVIIASTAAYPGSPERIEIFGTRASASLIGGALTISHLDGTFEHIEAEGRSGSGAGIMDFPHDAHRAVIADFGDAVREGRDPAIPGREAVISQRFIEAILEHKG
ncbi:MAG: Gfo/Idh/MocA family protein [Bosea sp. (in: a-proteobacteria)]